MVSELMSELKPGKASVPGEPEGNKAVAVDADGGRCAREADLRDQRTIYTQSHNCVRMMLQTGP
jgi:hypothetical protein